MRKILLNLGLKSIGKDIFGPYNKLRSLEYNSDEANKKIQKEKLKKLVIHSYKYVPYYRKVLRDAEVIVNGKVNLDNFSKIPILTKDIIRNNFEDLKSRDANYKKRKPYLNTSGGSTGEPVKFVQDRVTWSEGMAGAWLFYSFVTDFPCKHLKLWGSERDILKGGYGLKGIIKNWIYDRKLLNSFKMSKKDMFNYVETINEYKPKIIEAYVQSIYELANFIENNNLKVFSPKGIITAAGTLYPDFKKLIEGVFNCKVHNLYGSREVGGMACSCERDEGLHLNIFNHYFEILNDKLEPCKPEEIGKVYVTTLNNYSMPLIRYDIGDMAVPAKNEQCSCGKGLPLVQSVRGRDVNLFKTRLGEAIDGEYFTHLFYLKEWVKKFQVIQKDYDWIIIKIILNRNRNGKDEKSIIYAIKKVMGGDCKVKFEFVDEIKPSRSGKYLYTISEVE